MAAAAAAVRQPNSDLTMTLLPGTLFRRITCMASATLAMHGSAFAQATTDSLGLEAFNRSMRIIDGELSINLTHRRFRSLAPELKPIGIGPGHAVWGTFSRADRVRIYFLFDSDSGGILSRAISSRSRLIEFEARTQSDSTDGLLTVLAAYDAVVDAMGAPTVCDRDTLVRDGAAAIFVNATAVWRRNGATAMITEGFNMVEPLPKNRAFAGRFSSDYSAYRTSDPFTKRDEPTRHSSPCLLIEKEVRDHAIPLDSAAYSALRSELLKRVPKPDH